MVPLRVIATAASESENDKNTCTSNDADASCRVPPNEDKEDDGTTTAETEPPLSELTLEIGEEMLQRIQAALHASGIVSDQVDDAMLQKMAAQEVQRFFKEEEQSRQARERFEQQRRHNLQSLTTETSDTNVHSDDEDLPEFPYELQPPPEPLRRRRRAAEKNSNNSEEEEDDIVQYSLDFVQYWNPPGGGRYAEYADGTSPYKISQDLGQKSDDMARLRRPYVKQAMQYAWEGYRQYAFGYDEIRPQSKQGTNHWGGIAVSLVDSLDTLWLMKMTKEFEEARDYVRDTLSHDQNSKVSVFETTIRSLGGLLAAYDWSRDHVFLEEAMDLARRLMRAFVHPVAGETILPFGEINLQSGQCNNIPWAGGNAILSEFGTLQIEFRYLDQVVQTSETRGFREKVETIFELLHEMSPENGLYPYYMHTKHETPQSPGKKSKVLEDNSVDDELDQQRQPAKPYFSNGKLHASASSPLKDWYNFQFTIANRVYEHSYFDFHVRFFRSPHIRSNGRFIL